VVSLDWITVAPHLAGRGYGTAALQKLCSLADQHGVILQLEVGGTRDGGPSAVDLAGWYGRHGFVQMGGYMQRDPEFLAGSARL
jgi:GNAT superfamily N-acetyltransferase